MIIKVILNSIAFNLTKYKIYVSIYDIDLKRKIFSRKKEGYGMKNNYETLDQKLDSIHGKKKTTKPVKASKSKKIKSKDERTKRNKKFIVGTIALFAASAITLTSLVATLVSCFKKKNNDVPKTLDNSIVQIDDMGTELELSENNTSKYGKTTGNIDANELAEKNGKIYKDSADKSDKVGTSSVDTKGDSLVVEDGKVKDKTDGYEIKDESGKVIENGDDIPDGYKEVEEGKLLPEGYVYSDATYYNEEGNILLNKGDRVSKEKLEYIKKNFSTTKPSKTETSSITDTSSKQETTSNKGKVNTNGTYTDSYGNIWISYEDYVNGMLDLDGVYTKADGILRYSPNVNKNTEKQLVK